jgi:hypothetical protein
MLNWEAGGGLTPVGSMPTSFDDALDLYHKLQLRLSSAARRGARHRSKVDIPTMRPHWLWELVVDIF